MSDEEDITLAPIQRKKREIIASDSDDDNDSKEEEFIAKPKRVLKQRQGLSDIQDFMESNNDVNKDDVESYDEDMNDDEEEGIDEDTKIDEDIDVAEQVARRVKRNNDEKNKHKPNFIENNRDIDTYNNDDEIVDDEEEEEEEEENMDDRDEYLRKAQALFGTDITELINPTVAFDNGDEEDLNDGNYTEGEEEHEDGASTDMLTREHSIEDLSDQEDEPYYSEEGEHIEENIQLEGLDTEIKKEIETEDIPERMIFDYKNIKDISDDDSEMPKEAAFILKKLFPEMMNTDINEDKDVYIDTITNVLHFLHKQHMDPLYIYYYQKDYISILQPSHLYTIYKLDIEYRKLLSFKDTLFEELSSLRQQIDTLHESYTPLYKETVDSHEVTLYSMMLELCMDIEQDIQTEDDELLLRAIAVYIRSIKDIYRLPIHTSPKRSHKQYLDGYTYNIKMIELAMNYNVSISKMNTNIKSHSDLYPAHKTTEELSVVATPYIINPTNTANATISRANKTYAFLLANNYCVFSEMIGIYEDVAVLNSYPTKTGVDEIDMLHPLYGYQRLHNKPYHSIDKDMISRLEKGKNEGLLEYEITSREGVKRMKDILTRCFVGPDNYFADYIYKSNEVFEEELRADTTRDDIEKSIIRNRMKIIDICVSIMEKRINTLLINKAKRASSEYIALCCAQEFNKSLERCPFLIPDTRSGNDYSYISGSILSFYISNNKNVPTVAVLINSEGNVVDYIDIFLYRRNIPEEEQKIQEAIKQIYIDNQPELILLNTSAGIYVRKYQTYIMEIIKSIDASEVDSSCRISLIDDHIPYLKAQGDQGEEEFHDYKVEMRTAIYMARYIQNSMFEIASLFNKPYSVQDSDIFLLQYHPLQDSVDRAFLYPYLYNQMCIIAAKRGISLNQIKVSPYKASILPFIPGLGTIRAQQLVNYIQNNDTLTDRKQILQDVFPEGIYRNCIGFLRIDDYERGLAAEIHPLDCTHVHPDQYHIAITICQTACGDLTEDVKKQKSLVDKCIHDAMRYTRKSRIAPSDTSIEKDILSFFDKESFIKENETYKKSIESIYTWLYNNIYEGPYIELWDLFEKHEVPVFPPDPLRPNQMTYKSVMNEEGAKQLFYLLINETEESFTVGTLESVVVQPFTTSTPRAISCLLDSGIFGRIIRTHFDPPSGDYSWSDMPKYLQPGTKLQARVVSINYEYLSCMLSTKVNDILSPNAILRTSPRVTLDKDFSIFEDQWEIDYKRQKQKQANIDEINYHVQQNQRLITHPNYMSKNKELVMEYLNDKPIGDAIFRPSREDGYLALTIKVHDNDYTHVKIQEIYDANTKKYTYIIDNTLFTKKFSDFDEILANFVDPLISIYMDITSSSKFLAGTQEAADQYIFDEYSKNVHHMNYCLCLSQRRPMNLSITFYQQAIIHEYALITTEGIYYQKRMFSTTLQLITWFKKHFNEIMEARKKTILMRQ